MLSHLLVHPTPSLRLSSRGASPGEPGLRIRDSPYQVWMMGNLRQQRCGASTSPADPPMAPRPQPGSPSPSPFPSPSPEQSELGVARCRHLALLCTSMADLPIPTHRHLSPLTNIGLASLGPILSFEDDLASVCLMPMCRFYGQTLREQSHSPSNGFPHFAPLECLQFFILPDPAPLPLCFSEKTRNKQDTDLEAGPRHLLSIPNNPLPLHHHHHPRLWDLPVVGAQHPPRMCWWGAEQLCPTHTAGLQCLRQSSR